MKIEIPRSVAVEPLQPTASAEQFKRYISQLTRLIDHKEEKNLLIQEKHSIAMKKMASVIELIKEVSNFSENVCADSPERCMRYKNYEHPCVACLFDMVVIPEGEIFL